MVSTRHHPRDFPPPDLSPTKSSPRKSSRLSTTSPAPESISTSLKRVAQPVFENITVEVPSSSTSSSWSHTTTHLTLLWLLISIPLVTWDALYILLRPHTFSGGKLQWPVWKLYEIYAKFDLVYGPEAWERSEGFGGAQGAMNAVEVLLYAVYTYIVLKEGRRVARGTGVNVKGGPWEWVKGGRMVDGKLGGRVALLGFAAAVMTLSKTVLYYLNEYYSGYANIRHNDWVRLVGMYGVMNGLWVAFPAYMTYAIGSDILAGLDRVSNSSASERKKQ